MTAQAEEIVCDCNRLTRGDIARAIAAGARRPTEVYEGCGRAAQCGRCLEVIRAMLAAALR
ncbi:(2Fe-2S)-binding protein, partial [Neoroseomonas rubea]|uniref:(2Fe-2S)-binding protein n=1 Tax=Neoroseomonas rubea TaxID=2748666 RepID=UPI0018DF3829